MSQLQARAEGLLAGLAGVLSARVRFSVTGRVQEIHVLATPELHPKQVVRNVESALRAGLGLEFDRRVVSVAQMSGPAPAPATQPGDGSTAIAPATQSGGASTAAPDPSPRRLRFVGFDARTEGSAHSACTVRLARDRDEFTGHGEGAATRTGRAEAAARALFAALAAARGDDLLALRGAAVVESNGRAFVLVAANAVAGREHVPLTGAAALGRSPEEAAILAGLQATNRWSDPARGPDLR
jgi:hypothetical protein